MNEQEIFLAAVDIEDPRERAQYLAQACGQDAALRRRIDTLLEFHQRDDAFLEKPLLETRPWDAADEEQSGAVIGRYKLLEKIGEGAFGTVYMAQQLEPIQRRVALKLIKPGMDSKQVIGRFEIERQALALMNHPNIAKVFDGGATASGRPYFVMELVEGIPMTHFCDQVQMPLRKRLELLAEVCRAVQHAHQKGIIHRDLKPSNVLVTLHDGKPVPKIIDFGIAKATEQQLTNMTVFTRFQHFIGTPQYMSPEQASLSGLDIDTRSDVYALGVMLYELLTGTTPCEADTARQVALDELCRIIREEQAPPPSKRISTLGEKLKATAKSRDTDPVALRSVLRGELDWITSKALEKDRTRRYDSANQLAEDIQRFLNHEPVLAGPPGMGYRIRKSVERKRGLVTAVAAVATTLVVGTVVSTMGFFSANRARQDEVLARRSAEDEAERNRRLLYVSDMNVALQAWEAANLGRVLELLNRHRPRDGQTDLRGFEWYYIWRLCQRGRATPLIRSTHKTWCLDLSPVGKTLALGCDDGAIRLWDLGSRRPLRTLAGHSGWIYTVSFSPDGKWVASAGLDQTVRLWEVATSRQQEVLRGHSDVVNCVAFALDDNLLASAGYDKTVKLWDLTTFKEHTTLDANQDRLWGLAFSPNGELLASSGDDGTIKLWDRPFGQGEPTTLKEHTNLVRCVTFSRDGTMLASGSLDNTVVLWDTRTRRKLRTLAGHTSAAESVAFAPDGKTLASGGDDRTVRLWDVATGRQLDVLKGHSRDITRVVFTPDGDTLVSNGFDGVVRLWSLKVPPERTILAEHGGMVMSVAYSRDGRYLASGGEDKRVNLWDARSGEHLKTFDGHATSVYSVALSPEGRIMASGGDGLLMLTYLDTGRSVRLEAHSVLIKSLVFSPDGKMLASAGNDHLIKVRDLPAVGKEPRILQGHTNWIESISFSPDGTRLASGSYDRTVRIWNVAGRAEPLCLTGHTDSVHAVAFSPDGKLVASASADCTVRFWDMASGHERDVLHGHSGVIYSVAFSPNGETLASASNDGTVRLWDVASGEERATLTGHFGRVMSVAFSPDGLTLASGGGDHTMRLWRAAAADGFQAKP